MRIFSHHKDEFLLALALPHPAWTAGPLASARVPGRGGSAYVCAAPAAGRVPPRASLRSPPGGQSPPVSNLLPLERGLAPITLLLIENRTQLRRQQRGRGRLLPELRFLCFSLP